MPTTFFGDWVSRNFADHILSHLNTSGLAADQFGPDPAKPDAGLLKDWVAERQIYPTYAMGFLG